jgi:pimeloyl-ACP methyl ester carboxylesterase
MNALRTDLLEIIFEQSGADEGPPVLLLHGWPEHPGCMPLFHFSGSLNNGVQR